MTPFVRSTGTVLSWLVLASLAALLLAGCANSEAERPAPAERPTSPVTVSTATAEERVLPAALDVTGTLMADAQADVASELDLRVVQVLVERGQAVRAGAALARLDQEDVMNQLR